MIRNIRPKNIRRFMLLLSLIFPVVYLCGGLFFALAGAHGEQMFAEPVYTEEYVQVESVSDDDYSKYRLVVNDGLDFHQQMLGKLPSGVGYGDIIVSLKFNGLDYIRFFVYSLGLTLYQNYDNSGYQQALVSNNQLSLNTPWYFYPNNIRSLNWFVGFNDIVLEKLMYVPTDVVSENNSAYTDFIFSQPFAKNNFISTLGRDLINGSSKGFAPVAQLFRYINVNVMHFETTDMLAMFGFGYVYYVFNVLIIYEVILLVAWLLLIPIKVMDGFHKEDNRNDS